MSSSLVDAVLQAFGADGTYTPTTGAPVSMRIEIKRDVMLEDEEGGAYIRRNMAFFASGQVTPKRGDTITIGDETWFVDRVESNDGYMTSVELGRSTA